MADKMQVEQVFKDKAQEAVAARKDMLQASFAAYKARTSALIPAFQKRQKFIDTIPQFWFQALGTYRMLQPHLDEVDGDALKALSSFTIEYQEDPREYDLVFEFAENPNFTDKKLVKSFRLAPLPATAGGSSSKTDGDLEALRQCDLQWPLVTEPVKISWKDDDHNLTKKKPRVDPTALEEFDMMDSLGSFFCFFEENHDAFDIAEHLEQVYQEALDVYAQLNEPLDDDSDDEEDDDDMNEEIDLDADSDEERKKRKRSKKN